MPITVVLRPVRPEDLPALFEFQCDPEASAMAGTKPRTREAFFANWERSFADPWINSRVIEICPAANGETLAQGAHAALTGALPVIVGSIGCFRTDAAAPEWARDNVGYAVARPFWGQGIASRALAMFLTQEQRRPLHATTVVTNLASQRILRKCGFRFLGTHMGEETERYLAAEVAEFVLDG